MTPTTATFKTNAERALADATPPQSPNASAMLPRLPTRKPTFTAGSSFDQEDRHRSCPRIAGQARSARFDPRVFPGRTEGLAGETDSIMVNRAAALERKVKINDDKVKKYNEMLTRKRDFLLKQFYTLETTLAKIQSNTDAINSIASLAQPMA